LNELNRTADMILEQVAESKTKLDININGAEKVEITGPQGDKGEMPIKGKDYFTPQEVSEITQRIQRSIKVPKDGVTPVKGKDYFTDEEVRSIVNEVASLIPVPENGRDGENAELDYEYVLNEVMSRIPKVKNGKDGKNGSPDTPEQVKAKLLEAGITYTDLKDAPVFRPSSKTVSLKELDDVDLSGATINNGKYVIGGGPGGSVDSVNGQTGVVVLDASDIDAATNRNYVTDAEKTAISNTSGTNTGDVTLVGTPEYLTIDGQVITRNQIDLTTDVTGELPFENIAQIATNRILGRSTAGTGDIEALTNTNARTVLGLSTSNSPQFTGVNVGHATDTTITRVSSGVIAVEGAIIPTISSTDTLTNKTIDGAENTITNVGCYTLLGYSPVSSTSTLAASTTYYFGSRFNNLPSTLGAFNRIDIPKTATIKRIRLQISATTIGSSGENVEIYLRVNNSTDTLLTDNVPINSNIYYTRTWTGSIPVTAGDYVEFKMVTPAWSVVPNIPGISGQIYLEY